jgi:antibiotic biosynthesis monooxygenase (ABM) superfamily enzyme
MTAMLASLGLLPAAMSHAIGSDTQRPFAIVIIGGLVSSTLLTMLLLPTLYELFDMWFGSGRRKRRGEPEEPPPPPRSRRSFPPEEPLPHSGGTIP